MNSKHIKILANLIKNNQYFVKFKIHWIKMQQKNSKTELKLSGKQYKKSVKLHRNFPWYYYENLQKNKFPTDFHTNPRKNSHVIHISWSERKMNLPKYKRMNISTWEEYWRKKYFNYLRYSRKYGGRREVEKREKLLNN